MSARVVDWPSLLGELRRLGFSLRSVAGQVGTSHSMLVEYAQGVTRPQHASGERLIGFYLQATDKTRNDLPMTQEFSRS